MIPSHTYLICNAKVLRIESFLDGTYWGNDIWNVDCDFFTETGIRTPDFYSSNKNIDFSGFSEPIQKEIKYMFATQLELRIIKLRTLIPYACCIKKLASFLMMYYPQIQSVIDIPL